jgi:CMP-2-keto-3-deoxyoctulosonic acid synthetase
MEEDLEQLKVLENSYRMKVFWHGTLESEIDRVWLVVL